MTVIYDLDCILSLLISFEIFFCITNSNMEIKIKPHSFAYPSGIGVPKAPHMHTYNQQQT